MTPKDPMPEEFEPNYPFHNLTPSSAEAPFERQFWSTDMFFDSLGRIHGTGGHGSNILFPPGTAVSREEGTLECWHRGRLHRLDGPAIAFGGRTLVLHVVISAYHWTLRLQGPANLWFMDGRLHREDGPAVQDIDGSELWYQSGRLHRLDGPAVIDERTGIRWWCVDGRAHRDDGPALETDVGELEWDDLVLGEGAQIWFRHGKLHRDDGPAIRDDEGTERWYRNGRAYSPRANKEP